MPRLATGQNAPAFTPLDHAGRSLSLTAFPARHLGIFFTPPAPPPGSTPAPHAAPLPIRANPRAGAAAITKFLAGN